MLVAEVTGFDPDWDEVFPDWRDDVVQGIIYLLHFTDPETGEHVQFGHAGHYLGWTTNLQQRLMRHGTKSGANLLWHAKQAGIGWEVTRLWRGTCRREWRLKVQGGHSRKCPLCGVAPRQALDDELKALLRTSVSETVFTALAA